MDLAGLFSTGDGVARLTGSRCDSCGDVAFPARRVCGRCGARELSPTRLSGRGVVAATTNVVTPPAGFDHPIEVALVDLEEGPRLFVLLTAPSPPGTRVQAMSAPVRDGDPGFAFQPVVT